MERKICYKKTGILVLFVLIFSLAFSLHGEAASAKLKLNKSSVTLYLNETKSFKLKATINGKSKKVTWSSSNKRIATVNGSGKVTAKKAGKAVITAKYGKAVAKCKITVKKESIKVQKSKAVKAYKKILEKPVVWEYGSDKIEYFALVDINRDGIKELLIQTYPTATSVNYIYTYSGGKVRKLCDGISGNIAYYTRAKILRINSRNGISAYYKMTGNTLSEIALTANGSQYYINGKKTTKKAYTTYLKKVIGSEKAKKCSYKKNVEANRNNL